MDAQKLYQIVKDWPKEACPKELAFTGEWFDMRLWTPPGMSVLSHSRITIPHAVMLFESAGMKWLIDNGRSPQAVKTLEGGYAVALDCGRNDHHYSAPTLIKAIAAAVKGAK